MNHDGVIQCPDQAALNGEADGTGTVAALQLELERSRRKLGQLQDQLAQTEVLLPMLRMPFLSWSTKGESLMPIRRHPRFLVIPGKNSWPCVRGIL